MLRMPQENHLFPYQGNLKEALQKFQQTNDWTADEYSWLFARIPRDSGQYLLN